jgi:hypothetical protein
MESKTLYFEEPGPYNTEATLRITRDRVRQLGLNTVVVASSHGNTARQALDLFRPLGVKVIVVTICASYEEEGWTMSDVVRRELEAAGARVLTGIHALGDDVSGAFGYTAPNSIVAHTYYTFCQGMKVAVEIVLMAADAGLIGRGEEVAAVAGTSDGADTAIIVKAAYPRQFGELKVREILAMPR